MATKNFWQFFCSNFFQFAREAIDPALFVIRSCCVFHLTNSYICTPILATGPSMVPTLKITGDFLLAERISNAGAGDIVLLRSPENPRKFVTKRIIGMEGQCVSFVEKPRESSQTQIVVVPKGHVWVEGDNIYDSRDSRHFGPVPYALIQGRVFWRVWPPSGFGALGRKEV